MSIQQAVLPSYVSKVAKKDRQSAEAGVALPSRKIHGVTFRRATTNFDSRGEIVEILSENHGPIEPIPHVYIASLFPRCLKGWVYHEFQHDRLFPLYGLLKVVLHDFRLDSPTHGAFDEIVICPGNRGVLTIPPYVAHAVVNIGHETAAFLNCLTKAYNYAQPDKHRISVASGVIPYDLTGYSSW
jgi:dTDP-4-dehydrorhamnose 3,5-epimerase-like enzyme